MARFASMITAVALAFPAVATAQSAAVRAVPVAAQAGKFIASESLWNCGADGCTTAKIASRPAIACAQVVREIGAVSSFAIGDKVLSAEELAKCNARAKPVTALARN